MKLFNCLHCGKENPKSYHHTNKYCGHDCQGAHTRAKRISQWLLEGKDWITNIPEWVRGKDGYLANTNGYKCSVCNITEHNNIALILECDHIDGNHKNNNPTNLRLICPNCHSQTSTYKNKNKGNGRDYRKI